MIMTALFIPFMKKVLSERPFWFIGEISLSLVIFFSYTEAVLPKATLMYVSRNKLLITQIDLFILNISVYLEFKKKSYHHKE